MSFKCAIESVMVEHALSGEKIYDVLGGNIIGAGKAVRADVAQLDSYSEGENYYLHTKWLNDESLYDFKMFAPKELECFSDYEMEKYLLDSINRSIAFDLCDASVRSPGQLDYSWNNHVEAMCSSVHDNMGYYQGLIKLLDGTHDGIQSPVIHPQMVRTLAQEGILELNAYNFMKFMPREQIVNSFMAFNDYITSSFKQRFFDSSQLRKGFDAFFKYEYLPKYFLDSSKQVDKELCRARF